MDLMTYTARLREEARAAVALGTEETRETMERLLQAIDPATRLVLIQALSDAAAEISADLPSGSIDTRLRGTDVEFVVDPPVTDTTSAGADAPHPPSDSMPGAEDIAAEDGDLVRITLRLPAGVKSRAEDLAQSASVSLNSWLIDAVRHATRQPAAPPRTSTRSHRRMTGWA